MCTNLHDEIPWISSAYECEPQWQSACGHKYCSLRCTSKIKIPVFGIGDKLGNCIEGENSEVLPSPLYSSMLEQGSGGDDELRAERFR